MTEHGAVDPAVMARDYDRTAAEYGWIGPEIVFGLAYAHVNPGQSILDIGIGTGLGTQLFHKAGLNVYGMDKSPEMVEACRSKGFTAGLRQHDLTAVPYPFETDSMDHAVSIGVLNFFSDLQPVFGEVARIVRDGGVFAFVVGERAPGEPASFVVGPEHTQTGGSVTMYRHGTEQIGQLMEANGFTLLNSLAFTIPMDAEHKHLLPIKAYVVRLGSVSSGG